jgi:hypothetical protein
MKVVKAKHSTLAWASDYRRRQEQEADGRRHEQEAGGRRQEAGGRKQKAESRKQK